MEYNQKASFDIDRVEKIPVPLLVVGLGGTGCDALQTIKTTFAERFIMPKDNNGHDLPTPSYTAYLGFDVMYQRPDGMEDEEYVDISLAGIDRILTDQDKMLYPFEKTWVNKNLRHITPDIMRIDFRQEARVVLSRNYGKVKQAIQGALNKIVSNDADDDNGIVQLIEIVVIAGIGGGTGSGIFLDMCQILREITRTYSLSAKLTGYIVMPDVSLIKVQGNGKREAAIKRNAYAALKELDFWMNVKQHKIPYIMEYGNRDASIAWSNPPFDHCILMSSTNINGTPYQDGYTAVLNTIAENLLHYMAEEAGAEGIYSYRQYEDNLIAIEVARSYPLYYGYRAVGAFMKQIPKKAILYYEGSALFKTFVPIRDDSGKLHPDRRMFSDGKNMLRAEAIIGNIQQLLLDFQNDVSKLPKFCSLDLKDDIKLKSVQNMNPPPHYKWHVWSRQVCAPTVIEASNTYLEKAWARFEELVRKIIMDPEQGPFALEAYLNDRDGLIRGIEEFLNTWKSYYRYIRSLDISQFEEACNTSWPAFRRPPILGQHRAMEVYLHSLCELYTHVNSCEFLEKHISSLEKLILRIREYLRDGLSPLCDYILQLEKEFNSSERDDVMLVQDIYDLNTVQHSINSYFRNTNARERLSRQLLEKMSKISLMSEKTTDTKTSGVQFVCGNIGLQEICRAIQQDLEEVYGKINNQSLDDIMHIKAGADEAAQQQWMNNLVNDSLNKAQPMFLQNPSFSMDSKITYSYLFMPQDAREHVHDLKNLLAVHDPLVMIIQSQMKDHLYALTTWERLPLYRYGLLDELRNQYEKDLNTEYSYGIHLVQNGDKNADFKSNWTKLPSPNPFFLFSSEGISTEQKQFEKLRKLVKRGMECRMIEIQKDTPRVKVSIHLLYTDENALMTKKDLKHKTEEIIRLQKLAAETAYSDPEIGQKILNFLRTGNTTALEEYEIRFSGLAYALGLSQEPWDPFDLNNQADLTSLEKANINFGKICVLMAETLIYRRPDILWALERQLPAYEKIYQEAKGIADSAKNWERRNDYAECAADILFYLDDIISSDAIGLKYKTGGQKYEMITTALLKDDIKNCEAKLIQAAAYLADLPEDNVVKADLTGMMTARKRELEISIDEETITLEEMNEIIKTCTKVRDSMAKEIESLECENHVHPDGKEQLKSQIVMAEKMKKILDQRIRFFKQVAKRI